MAGLPTNLRITPSQEPSQNDLDYWLGRAKARALADRLASEQTKSDAVKDDAGWVEEATKDTFTWVTQHTKTYNEHFREEGRPCAEESFPAFEYFRDFFELLAAEQIVWLEKSRDLMVSWACVAYLTLN